MLRSNLMDGEQVRSHKRVTSQLLSTYLYLLKKQDNLKSIPRLSLLQDILLELISNVDSKLQTSSLECLIKTNYASGLLHKYRKLLEGFADDEKFKDMI